MRLFWITLMLLACAPAAASDITGSPPEARQDPAAPPSPVSLTGQIASIDEFRNRIVLRGPEPASERILEVPAELLFGFKAGDNVSVLLESADSPVVKKIVKEMGY